MGAHSSAFLSVCTCNRFSKARAPHHLLWVNPIGDAHPITRAASRELQLPDAAFDESTERVDCVRCREPQRRRDPDPITAIVERLGHHRVRKHGQDRPCGEGKNKAHGVR